MCGQSAKRDRKSVELLEICGGTPLTSAARVAAAVGDRVPVSLVSWPFESIDGVAAFKAAYQDAHPHAG